MTTIRERRERLGLTQVHLAGLARIDPSKVSLAERSKCPSAEARMRKALDRAELAEHKARCRDLLDRRIAAAWQQAPDCEIVRMLRRQIKGRAWRLLDGGDRDGADLLLSLLPGEETRKLLDDFFGD